MKYYFLLFILCSATFLQAQDKPSLYCEVQSYALTRSKFHASVTFGKDSIKYNDAADSIKISTYIFRVKSNIDILNFMSADGWELAGTAIERDIITTYYFWFKRKE